VLEKQEDFVSTRFISERMKAERLFLPEKAKRSYSQRLSKCNTWSVTFSNTWQQWLQFIIQAS